MRYTQLTDDQVQHMLATIGVSSIDDLFAPVPSDLRLSKPLGIPEGLSELEVLREIDSLAAKNSTCGEQVCFLGAGAYDHFIPTVVDAMSARGEFVTAYTPYQAEASQGILQMFYEFQTMICQLTGMDVANASLYEVGQRHGRGDRHGNGRDQTQEGAGRCIRASGYASGSDDLRARAWHRDRGDPDT